MPGAAQILGVSLPYAAQHGLPADQVQQVSQTRQRALLCLEGFRELISTHL